MLGLSLLLRFVLEETVDEMWVGLEEGREGVPPCAHRHTNSRHSCFVPCALLMKGSLICLSTRWLYLNCCLGFLASCPLALEFMSCSLEWLYAGSRINCLAYISMAGELRKCTLFGIFFWQRTKPCDNLIAVWIHISEFTRRDQSLPYCTLR